jgi:hypothetical protein
VVVRGADASAIGSLPYPEERTGQHTGFHPAGAAHGLLAGVNLNDMSSKVLDHQERESKEKIKNNHAHII